MLEIRKRPQVIRDLIDIATYIANTDLDQSDRFLQSAEATFQNLAKMPGIGKRCQFHNSQLKNIRQAGVKNFKKYLVFYRASDLSIEIIRVIHGSRDLESLMAEDNDDEIE